MTTSGERWAREFKEARVRVEALDDCENALSLLAAASGLVEQADRIRDLALIAARDEANPWREIGETMGVTAQGSRDRWWRAKRSLRATGDR